MDAIKKQLKKGGRPSKPTYINARQKLAAAQKNYDACKEQIELLQSKADYLSKIIAMHKAKISQAADN